MENENNVINAVKATLYERVSNPLVSSFLLSWLIWNYKFILVFFSSTLTTIEKLTYIKVKLFPFDFDPLLSPQNFITILFSLLGPIVTTLFYLYVIYPKLGKKVYEDHKEHIREYKDIKVKIEGKTSMSDTKVLALKSELRTIKNIHSKQLDDKDGTIDILKRDLAAMTEDVAISRNKISELEDTIQRQVQNLEKLEKELTNEKTNNQKEREQIHELRDKDQSDKIQSHEELLQLKTKNKELIVELNNIKNISLDQRRLLSGKGSKNKLSSDAESLLLMLSHSYEPLSYSTLKQRVKFQDVRLGEALKKLINGKFVDEDHFLNMAKDRGGDGDRKILINDTGREYLIDNNLL